MKIICHNFEEKNQTISKQLSNCFHARYSQFIFISKSSDSDPQGQGGATKGMSNFTQEYIEKSLKLFLKTDWSEKPKICVKASSAREDSCFFSNHNSQRNGGATIGVKFFHRNIQRKIFKNRLCSNHDHWGYNGATIGVKFLHKKYREKYLKIV